MSLKEGEFLQQTWFLYFEYIDSYKYEQILIFKKGLLLLLLYYYIVILLFHHSLHPWLKKDRIKTRSAQHFGWRTTFTNLFAHHFRSPRWHHGAQAASCRTRSTALLWDLVIDVKRWWKDDEIESWLPFSQLSCGMLWDMPKKCVWWISYCCNM